MKVTIKFTKGNWHTFKKIKDMSIVKDFIVLTKIDGSVKVVDRNIVKYIRETKLSER